MISIFEVEIEGCEFVPEFLLQFYFSISQISLNSEFRIER